VNTIGKNTVIKKINLISVYTSSPQASGKWCLEDHMIKIKYRVFVTKYCNGTSWPCDVKATDKATACKIKHEFPTNRYIFHQPDSDFTGTVEDAIQEGHMKLNRMLALENENDKDKKKQQRAWFQYVIEVT
jgi:hypothetical protein